MKLQSLIPILFLVLAFDSKGITPASLEQIFCTGTHIAIGEIVDTNINCEKTPFASVGCTAILNTKIVKIVATAKSSNGYPAGAGIKNVGVEPGNTLELKWVYPNGYYLGSRMPIPSAEKLAEELKRQALIFTIHTGYGLWKGAIPIKKGFEDQDTVVRMSYPFYTNLWSIEKLPWAIKSIEDSPYCSNFVLW